MPDANGEDVRSDWARVTMWEMEADLQDGFLAFARRTVVNDGYEIACQLRSEGDELGLRRLRNIARRAAIDPAIINRPPPERMPCREVAEAALRQLERLADEGGMELSDAEWRGVTRGITEWIDHSGDEDFRIRLTTAAAELAAEGAPVPSF